MEVSERDVSLFGISLAVGAVVAWVFDIQHQDPLAKMMFVIGLVVFTVVVGLFMEYFTIEVDS